MNIVTLKRHIREAVKGQPLYLSRTLSQEAKQAKFEITQNIEQFGLDTIRVDSWISRANDNISVEWDNQEADQKIDNSEIIAFIDKCKEYGKVRDESNADSFRIVISVARPAEQSQRMTFDVPQIKGVVDITTDKQRANGTVMLLDKETSLKYTLHQNGYVRRIAPTSEYTKSVTNGREEQGAPIMKPGGGTPEEMVQCVINNIKLSRKKKFGESFNRAVSQSDLTLALREIRSRQSH